VHERRDDRLHIRSAALDVVVVMLIQAAAAGCTVNEHYLRNRFVGIAGIAAVLAPESGEKVAVRKGLGLDGGILKVSEVGQENSIMIVVEPAHVGRIHRAEDDLRSVLGMVGIEVGIFVAE